MVRARLLSKSCGIPGKAVLCGYTVEGHADWGEHGSDIVCAAVSAIAQTTLFGLQEVLGEGEVEVRIRGGDMRVTVSPEKASEEGPRALLRALELGLRAIADRYPQSVSVDTEH